MVFVVTDAVASPLVEVQDVTKVYGEGHLTVRAVNGVSFSVQRGEFVALTGASGCGKSTLLNLIGTLDQPTSGRVLLCGEDVAQLPQKRVSDLRFATIGLVFQQFYLLPALTALDNVLLPLLPRRSRFNKRTRAVEMLEWVGLKEHLHKLPSQLSGGEQQRVCIARALATEPKIILADEPTGNLDRENGWSVFQILRDLCRTQGVAVLMATHNPEMAEHADQVLHMVDGRIAVGK